ncbi:MAG: ABC transporter ATP-binding protein, partial [Bacilli bacterium]|nr:ABC transporter ATP-binding protein [Bacilli bacterium]
MEKEKKNTLKTLLRLWKFLKDFKGKIVIVVIFNIVATAGSIIGPLLAGNAIDDYIQVADLEGLKNLLFILFGIYLANALFTWLSTYGMAKISESTLYQIRKKLFDHLEKLPLSYFDQNKKGDIMSRFTNDIAVISEALTEALMQILSSLITIIGVSFIMFKVNWILALVTMATVPLFFFFAFKLGVKSGKLYNKQRDVLGKLSSYSEEMFTGMKVVKSYVAEDESIEEFNKDNEEVRDISIKSQIVGNLIMPINGFVGNLGHILLIAVGAIMVVNGNCTIGVILIFMKYSNLFRRPINQLASLFAGVQSALAGANRVFEVMDVDSEFEEENKLLPFNSVVGHVKFVDVSFSYVKDKKILSNINLDAQPGETIALVGPTGAGKTTIVNLLTRFYDIEKGNIYIDGIDIREVKKVDLRQKIGLVLQDTYLFKGTVADNIRYGNKDATMDEIIEACRQAQAHSFIHRLPNGYDTVVEEEGLNFSQGERQLISIARAILSDPEILILDEATSNID